MFVGPKQREGGKNLVGGVGAAKGCVFRTPTLVVVHEVRPYGLCVEVCALVTCCLEQSPVVSKAVGYFIGLRCNLWLIKRLEVRAKMCFPGCKAYVR